MCQKSAAHVAKMARAETVWYGRSVNVKIGAMGSHGFIVNYRQRDVPYVPTDTDHEDGYLNNREGQQKYDAPEIRTKLDLLLHYFSLK